MSLVSFVSIRETTVSSMKQAIMESLGLIEYSFRKEIKSVAIKPNMCYYISEVKGVMLRLSSTP